MDELRSISNPIPSSSYLYFSAVLCLIAFLGLSVLGLVPGVTDLGESIILVGLSALVILSITPEIQQFREMGVLRRILLVFLVIQILSAVLVGSYLAGTISDYRKEVWLPEGLSTEQQVNEVFKMAIGVSEEINLLPLVAWIISFHCVFISTLTGISFFTSIPAGFVVLLGFLWGRSPSTNLLGYAFVLVILISLGLEGAMRYSRRARKGGLPETLFSGRGKEIIILSLVAIVLAPLVPDLRGVTPIEKFWNLNSSGAGNLSRALLRFSTLYQFVGEVRPDFSPALMVRTSAPRYWRGLVFVNYTGRSFLSEVGGSIRGPGQEIPSGWGDVGNLSREVTQTFTLLQNFPGVLLAAYEPRVVNGAGSFVVTDSLALTTRGSQSTGMKYSVLSEVTIPDPTVLREIDFGGGDQEFLQLPESLPSRVGELAEEIAEGLDNPFDVAVALAQHLRDYRYDLRVDSIPPGRDVVDYFLFDLQAGYCQHFAAAMTVLCRELGIPARVVTGFGSGSYDEDQGAYVVLQLNFHAWVELYFDGFGWVAFDPTPGGVGGPNVLDAAEVGAIYEGIIPYHGTIKRDPTSIYVTSDLSYVTEEDFFRVEGMVLQEPGDGEGVSRVPVNVTLYTEGLDIFPVMVWPEEVLPVMVLPARTYSDGSFTALCQLPPGITEAASIADLIVTCEGNDLYEPSSINISIPIRRRTTLELEIERYDPVTLAAALRGPDGPVFGQVIEIFMDGESLGELETNKSGMVSLVVDPDPGEHSLGARFNGNASLGAATASLVFATGGTGGGRSTQGITNVLWVIPVILAALIALWMLRKRTMTGGPESISRQYADMLKLLSNAGVGRPRAMTPHEFVLLVEERSGNVYRQVREITDRFVEATYGGGSLSQSELGDVKMLLGEMDDLLVKKRSWLGSLRVFLRSLYRDMLPGS